MKIYRILFLALVTGVFVQCQKEEDLGTVEYQYLKTQLQVDYNADTISMGDTIWIHSEIFGFLKDSASNENVLFGDAVIQLNIQVRAWNAAVQNFQTDYCSFDFESFASYLSYTAKTTMIGAYYSPVEGKQILEIGVVFHTPGIYSIDTDYSKVENYLNNSIGVFGGGLIEYYDLQNNYHKAYLIADIDVENNNMHLYDALSESDKNSFEGIKEQNESKYFFIKVNE